ncbi:hypothetical protein [Dactylosporangium sp. CA-092794]|uniref:hypothetical protein n=1 Tax=Dactylosporangium sp. CA-092794 TaxID=3239929 RepID=UPI003D8EFCE4
MTTPDNDLGRTTEHLIALSDDDLYLELGNVILGLGPGASPKDPEANRRFGLQWFNSRREQFQQTVCSNERVIAIRRSSDSEQLIAVATIADALMAIVGLPASTVVSILIIRLGLDSYCDRYWS